MICSSNLCYTETYLGSLNGIYPEINAIKKMQNKNKYYSQIISLKNIKEAFNELKEKFYNPLTGKYSLGMLARGIDGDCFAMFQKRLNDNLKVIQKALIDAADPLPSIDLKIPKNSNPNKFRTISISSLGDKIKHQAICRVIEPVLENIYADNLYSYREGKGSYKAIKDFRKAINEFPGGYCTYKVDMKDYFDNIDHKILMKLFNDIFHDGKLALLIKVFLKQFRLDGNDLNRNKKGVIQGVAISAHLANLYLADLDNKMENNGTKYFRVGDDIIVLNQDENKIREIAEHIEKFLTTKRNLPINREKTKIYKYNESFDYLGYEIQGHTIRIAKRNCERMKQKIRGKLNKKITAHIKETKVAQKELLTEIVRLIFPGNKLPDHIMWLRYFLLTNDVSQIKSLDNFIENRIRVTYFGDMSNKHYAELPVEKIRQCNYISLSKIYFDITQGRKTFADYVRKFVITNSQK